MLVRVQSRPLWVLLPRGDGDRLPNPNTNGRHLREKARLSLWNGVLVASDNRYSSDYLGLTSLCPTFNPGLGCHWQVVRGVLLPNRVAALKQTGHDGQHRIHVRGSRLFLSVRVLLLRKQVLALRDDPDNRARTHRFRYYSNLHT